MITAKNISVNIDGKIILNDASCEIGTGITCVLGPNGAGKSTLLKCLSGGIVPDAGSVALDNKPLFEWPVKDLAKHRAVLGQNLDVGFPFKAIDIVMMGRSPYVVGSETKGDFRIAEQALKVMDALHFKNRIYTTLSGGEKQRIQIARVLAQIEFTQDDLSGQYLFLDEPTSALDLKYQKVFRDIMISIKNKGLSILCIVHDINYALSLADHIFLMKSGCLKSTSAPIKKNDLAHMYDVEIIEIKNITGKQSIFVA